MGSHIKKLVVAVVGLMMIPIAAGAQGVQLGGLVDFEIRKGGGDSSPTVNQTPGDGWSLYTPNVRLFVSGDIADNWGATVVLQSDYLYGDYMSDPFFSSLNANWLPFENKSLNVTIGRFITPFGMYSRRLLSSQNPFVHFPMTMARYVPVDKERGFFPGSGSYDGYSGQSILYQRLYSQGIMIDGGSLIDAGYTYRLAATLVSASGYTTFGYHDQPAFIGSFTVQPAIWSKIGISVNYGPYMNESDVNYRLTNDQLTSYKQLTFSGRAEFSYHYWVLSGEYTWNRWEAPWIGSDPVNRIEYWDLDADISHYLVELQYRLPFLVGSYTGVRFEQLVPGDLTDDNAGDSYGSNNNSGYPNYTELPDPWTDDVTRFEFVAGYDINRQVQLKISYLLSTDDSLDDDVFAIQLSAGF